MRISSRSSNWACLTQVGSHSLILLSGLQQRKVAVCLLDCGLYLAIIISHCRSRAVNRCLRPTLPCCCVWLRLRKRIWGCWGCWGWWHGRGDRPWRQRAEGSTQSWNQDWIWFWGSRWSDCYFYSWHRGRSQEWGPRGGGGAGGFGLHCAWNIITWKERLFCICQNTEGSRISSRCSGRKAQQTLAVKFSQSRVA